MAGIGTAIVFINGNLTGLNKSIGDAERYIKRSFGNILRYGQKFGEGLTLAGGGILAALGLAGKGAADFDKAMRETNTLINLGGDDYKKLSKQVLDLSSELGIDAVQAAQALYQTLSAGVPKENAIDFLRVASKAGIGGVTDTKTAVDGLSTVLNAFQMPMNQAARVADTMFTAVKTGKTTFGELAQSIFSVAPLAAATGVKFEEVAAAVSTLTKQGVPTSVATTQIRAAIQGLIRPSGEMTKIFQAAGYESGEMALKQIGLQRSLEIVAKATGGSKGEMTSLLGSIEGVGAALGVSGKNAPMFATDLKAAQNAAGASSQAFDEMNESAARQWEMVRVQMKNVSIEIGNMVVPAFQKVVESLKPVIQNISDWIGKNPELVSNLVIGAAAFGAFALAVGPLLIALPGIVTAASGLIGVLKAAGITMKLAAGPFTGFGALLVGGLAVGGIIAGVGALAETFIKLAIGSKDVSNFISRWVDSTFPNFGRAIDSVFDKIVGLIDKFTEWIGLSEKKPQLGGGASMDRLTAAGVKVGDWGASGPMAAAHAMGGIVRSPFQLVGERGPELAALPMGSRIFNARDTADMMRGGGNGGGGPVVGTMNVTINTRGNKLDERECVDVLTRALKQVRRSRN